MSVDILIIDDELMLQESVGLVIEMYGGTPHLADTCEEGIQLLKENPKLYLAVLTDLNPFPKNGTDVVYHVLASETPDLPVYIMTGGAKPELEQLAKSLVGDRYLSKPISFPMYKQIVDQAKGV